MEHQEHTTGKAFYQRHLNGLENHNMEILKRQYHADAVFVNFDFTVRGRDSIIQYLNGYLEHLGYLKLRSTDKFVETDDAIFFEATVESQLGIARVYDIFILQDAKATHHFAGVISLHPHKKE